MITVKNAKSYLEDKIGEDADDLKKVLETFKDFCKEPVEGEEDKEILFECGVYPGLTGCNTPTSGFAKNNKDRWGINSL